MKFIQYFFIITFLFSVDGQVISIDGVPLSSRLFYSRYPKQQWGRADSLQKDKMINDFINRELCVLEAEKIGFTYDPEVAVKVRDRSLQLLVNETYEYLVAKPLISEKSIEEVKKHAVREVFVYHILIGYSDSGLRNPPSRTRDEALLRAQSVRSKYLDGVDFKELAKKFSDDPSAVSNGGELGWLGWGSSVQEFQLAAFSLKKGILSDPVQTNFGYHLILVEGDRPSDLSFLIKDAFENAVFNLSKSTVRHLLKDAAVKYDTSKMRENMVYFNQIALEKMVDKIDIYRKERSISGPGRVDAVSFLEELEDAAVVCVYNGKGYGPRWFGNRLSKIPPSRHPSFGSVESVESAFKIILLQDMAVNDGLTASVDRSFSYKQRVDAMLGSLLYDVYLKHLVNSAPKPDSLDIKDYYENNKYEKYMDPEKVTIREIKVKEKGLADSLLLLLNKRADFSLLASQFSSTNPEGGGLLGPFSKNRYQSLSVAFSMDLGEISGKIINPDNSISIIRLEEKFTAIPLEFRRVYARIESLLLKEAQNLSKTNGIIGLRDKYSVVINPEFYPIGPGFEE